MSFGPSDYPRHGCLFQHEAEKLEGNRETTTHFTCISAKIEEIFGTWGMPECYPGCQVEQICRFWKGSLVCYECGALLVEDNDFTCEACEHIVCEEHIVRGPKNVCIICATQGMKR